MADSVEISNPNQSVHVLIDGLDQLRFRAAQECHLPEWVFRSGTELQPATMPNVTLYTVHGDRRRSSQKFQRTTGRTVSYLAFCALCTWSRTQVIFRKHSNSFAMPWWRDTALMRYRVFIKVWFRATRRQERFCLPSHEEFPCVGKGELALHCRGALLLSWNRIARPTILYVPFWKTPIIKCQAAKYTTRYWYCLK